jgi:hypothetical protein
VYTFEIRIGSSTSPSRVDQYFHGLPYTDTVKLVVTSEAAGGSATTVFAGVPDTLAS